MKFMRGIYVIPLQWTLKVTLGKTLKHSVCLPLSQMCVTEFFYLVEPDVSHNWWLDTMVTGAI